LSVYRPPLSRFVNPDRYDMEFGMPQYILTGTAGAGKTAVLRQLEVNGLSVVEEAATDVIALSQSMGQDSPWTEPAFIDRIVALQRLRQANTRAPETETVFFDRSPVCTLALSRYLGFATSCLLGEEIDRILRAGVYEPTVFFVRQQGFIERTAARQITFEDAREFERVHEQTYRELGYGLVDVPAGPLGDRVALIQQTLGRSATTGPNRRTLSGLPE
jgi:predicted ATPase